jgi:anti-anti-sigma factor
VFELMDFNATSLRDGHRSVVLFDGELDCASEGLARAEVEIALARGGTELVIDLRGVSFLDGRGVHVLLDARSACRDRHLRLTLIPGPPCVQRVLELCNVRFEHAEPEPLAA